MTGLESIAASENSQILREKTSIRTREKKLKLWKETLEKFIPVIIQLDDYRLGKPIGNYEVVVDFEDYDLKTTLDRTNEAAIGISSKTWDMKTSIDYIHTDLSEEEKVLMRVNIKIENGINVFTKEEEMIYKKYISDYQENEAVPIIELDDDETVIDTENEFIEVEEGVDKVDEETNDILG